MRIQVSNSPAAQRLAHTRWSTQVLGQNVISPAMRDIADRLIQTLTDKFNGPIRYQGEMAGGFAQQDLNAHAVGITQSAAHELQIREGTQGPYSGFPGPVVKWAIAKLGVPPAQAYAIAKSVQLEGTADTFVSEYPTGQRRFEYAEWVVEVEHKADLAQWANGIGGGIVEYVTTGNTWKKANL